MASPLQQAVLTQLQNFPKLDPSAVLAVSGQEGLSGRIGDGGHAFGPFQMNNAGGVLTGRFAGESPEQIQAWASSPEGINEALSAINKVAGGLKGADAVKAIVSRYERPADPTGEIARAAASLGGIHAQVPSTPAGTSMADSPLLGGGQAVQQSAGMNLMAMVMQSSQAIASGQPATFNPTTLAQLLSASQGVKDTSTVRSVLSADPGAAQGVVGAAKQYLGVPYAWGGTDPTKGLDCSAFVQRAFADIGVKIPRVTTDQFRQGIKVDLKDIRPGDAVYTEPGAGPGGGPGHVGLYIGNGTIQESPHTGDVNKTVSLTDFLSGGIVGVRRFTR